MQDTDGTFYGTAELGGSNNSGTIYRLSMGLGPFVKTLLPYGAEGDGIDIVGTNLLGTTSVTFNGVPASFVISSPFLIVAHVPAGAASGPVQVTTPGGVLSSNVAFQVLAQD
jgi:uncharacterized repeat protein (TIGR03803 family)